MFKHFLEAFGFMLLFLAGWSVILAILLGAMGEAALIVVFIGLFASILPCMNIVGKKMFHYPGEGTPIPLEQLKNEIRAINEYDVPVMVTEKDGELVVTWKYVDAKWWVIFGKQGLKEMYELHIKFNDAKKEATLIDVQKSVSWRKGPTDVRLHGGFFGGIIFGFKVDKLWGIKENFSIGKVFDFTFDPLEIKNPVMNTIIHSGWGVRMGMW